MNKTININRDSVQYAVGAQNPFVPSCQRPLSNELSGDILGPETAQGLPPDPGPEQRSPDPCQRTRVMRPLALGLATCEMRGLD